MFVTCTAAQTTAIDTKLAAQYFRQLKQTSDRDAAKTWGEALYGPIMFVDARSGSVVASQADLEHKLVARDGVFVGTLPSNINPANTAIDWAGVHWTMVMWPVSEFRQSRERLLLHECFHRLQEKLGLPARDAVNSHLDTLNGRIWIQMEWRALERALRVTGADNVIGIDASNTVYPTMRLVDTWGVLTVSNGAWLERAPTGHLLRARIPAPTDLSARPLKGEGWSLEVASGWEVVAGERSGDLIIRKRS